MFLKFREDFWVVKFSKTSTFEVHKIFSEFCSPSFGWVLPVAWLRAAAPEAQHRCTWQPTKAAIPWSSGSWRRRRPWMHRPQRAVASETSWGMGLRCEEVNEDVDGLSVSWISFITSYGKPHEALGFRCEGKWMKTKCGSGRNVAGSSFLVARYCFQFLWRESAKKHVAPTFGVFCCLYVFCTSFCYSVRTRHVLMTILVWQYFGGTIAFQNW